MTLALWFVAGLGLSLVLGCTIRIRDERDDR